MSNEQAQSASEKIQEMTNQLSAMKRNRSDALSQLEQLDEGIKALTNAINGVSLGLQLAKDKADAERAEAERLNAERVAERNARREAAEDDS